MTNLQIEHLVERWEDRHDVKNQMGKFVHYLLLKKESDMVKDLWSSREDICYGVNGGWCQGREAVEHYFGWFPGYTAKVAACLKAKFPDKLGDKSDQEIFGVGLMELKSSSNYVVFANDFLCRTGHAVSELQSIYIRGTGRDEIDFGQPTIPMLAHDPSYTWCDNYPPMTARPSGPPS